MSRRVGALAVLAVGIGTLLGYPSWITGTPYGFGDDALEYSVPFARFVLDELAAGRLPLWNPFQDGGMPTLAQPPWMGPLYPGLALFAWLPAGRALDAGFALHVLSFALGSYALARRRGLGRLPAVLVAWAVALGTPMRTLFRMGYLPETVAVSFLPWLLLLAERGIRERAHLVPATAAAGLVLGAMHLGGHLVASGVVVLSLALYALALGAVRVRRERRPTGIVDALLFLVAAELLGLAVAAPQIAGLVSAGLESTLVGGRPVAAEEYAYLEQAWRAGGFVFARFDPVAKGHLFVGTVLLLFLPLAGRRRGAVAPPDRPTAFAAPGLTELAVLGGGAALLSTGNATPIWDWLRAALPPLRIFSYFYFFIVPVGLALALAAGLGFQRWREAMDAADRETRRSAGRAPAAMILVLLAVALATLAVTAVGGSEALRLARAGVVGSLPETAAALAASGALLWVTARLASPRARGAGAWLVAGVVLAELLGHGLANPRIPELGRRATVADGAAFSSDRSFDRDAVVEALPEPGAGRVLRVERSRYAASWALKRNEGLVQRYEDVEQAAKLPFARLVELTDGQREIDFEWGAALARSKALASPEETMLRLTEGSTALRVLDLLAVRAIVTDGAVLGADFARGPRHGLIRVFERRAPPPRVYAVAAWDVVAGASDAIRATLDPRRDPWRRPAVEGGGAGAAPPAPVEGAVAPELGELAWEPGRLSVVTRGGGPALVVLGEMAHRGWRVEVDGRRAPALVANGIHLAVAVPAGEHRVEARYRPRGVVYGAVLAVVALLGALVVGRPLARLRVPPWRPGVPLWW